MAILRRARRHRDDRHLGLADRRLLRLGQGRRARLPALGDTVNAKGGILGRQVQLKIVDDASSPTQVVTNYQNLINKDHVDLVFGPFSSCSPCPASQVAERYNYAFLELRPAVARTSSRRTCTTSSSSSRRRRSQSGDVFADYILVAARADQRPKTAAYAELDDPFSAPIAENIRARFEAAGIKTVYKQVYPSETQDLSPIMAQVVAAKPDVIVGGTQSEDAYAQVKSLVQLKFNPKFMFHVQRRELAGWSSPTRSGAATPSGIMSAARLVPGLHGDRQRRVHRRLHQGVRRDGRHDRQQQRRGLRRGQLLEEVATKTGKVDNATIIATLHQGTLADACSATSRWAANGAPAGRVQPRPVAGRQAAAGLPGADRAGQARSYPKPNWGG